MSAATSLIRAVLGPKACDEATALAILEKALLLEVDPLLLCAHRLNIPEDEVYRRAAHWCHIGIAHELPKAFTSVKSDIKLDALAEARSVRVTTDGRDILFVAPTFEHILGLRDAVIRRPELVRKLCIVPPRRFRADLAERFAARLAQSSWQRLVARWPEASAHLELTLPVRVAFVVAVVALTLFASFGATLHPALVLPLLVALFLVPALFRLMAAFRRRVPSSAITPSVLPDEDLPLYTVLIPLRDEAQMVPQLVKAMSALDYPPEKLDIKFVVESVSVATLQAVRNSLGDPRFELVVVPDHAPRTKPKALNYALPLARGSFIVIFDAEDIPAPGQLRLAASRFADDPTIDCLQAELLVDNASENWLTALYAAEYGGLFGYLLPWLAHWGMPMPLGGTSNHFRLSSLRAAGGWDAFNVTEDADLGVRLARLGLRTGTLESVTLEEAPVSIATWTRQRTRWMKGWMQTLLVHNRNPGLLLRQLGWQRFLVFEIYVGSLILSAPLHALFSLVWLTALVENRSLDLPVDPWQWTFAILLLLGYSGAATLSILGLVRHRRGWLMIYQLLLPLYWLLHGVAAIRALHELVARPFFWSKTQHGQSRVLAHAAATAPSSGKRRRPLAAEAGRRQSAPRT